MIPRIISVSGLAVRRRSKSTLATMALDEIDGALREIVGDEALAPHGPAVVFERRVEILAPMARGEAVVFLESAREAKTRVQHERAARHSKLSS